MLFLFIIQFHLHFVLFNKRLCQTPCILFLNQQLLQFGKSGFTAEKTKIVKGTDYSYFAQILPVRTARACQLCIEKNSYLKKNLRVLLDEKNLSEFSMYQGGNEKKV